MWNRTRQAIILIALCSSISGCCGFWGRCCDDGCCPSSNSCSNSCEPPPSGCAANYGPSNQPAAKLIP